MREKRENGSGKKNQITEIQKEICRLCCIFLFSIAVNYFASKVFREARMEAISPTPLMERNRKDFFSEAAFL